MEINDFDAQPADILDLRGIRSATYRTTYSDWRLEEYSGEERCVADSLLPDNFVEILEQNGFISGYPYIEDYGMCNDFKEFVNTANARKLSFRMVSYNPEWDYDSVLTAVHGYREVKETYYNSFLDRIFNRASTRTTRASISDCLAITAEDYKRIVVLRGEAPRIRLAVA